MENKVLARCQTPECIRSPRTKRSKFCAACYQRLQRKRHPDEWSANYTAQQRLKNLGISADTFDKQFALQGRRCAICRTNKKYKKGWHADHNHETGAFRGVLCSRCNIGLGIFRDDIRRLQRAIQYIKNDGFTPIPVRILLDE